MFTLPTDYNTIFDLFKPYFTNRIWSYVRLLIIGAILAPGQRTVAAILRIVGLSQERHFQNYHRVLNRAVWSSLALSQVLLRALLDAFVPDGPIVLGLDDTIERRRGAKIRAKGIYRDPVPLQSEPFCQSEWAALAKFDAADEDPLGQTGLGTAIPYGAVSFRALLSGTKARSQNLDRMGRVDAAAGAALVARSLSSRGSRQQLCSDRTVGEDDRPERDDLHDSALSPGCCPL